MNEWSGKFPDEVMHYELDWAPAIPDGDAIDTQSVTAEGAGSEGLTAEVIGTVGTVTRIRLSGGTGNTAGRVRFAATTLSGETLGENIRVNILAR